MMTIDEMEKVLDELAMELPEEFYDELNGGILLLPETKVSAYARNNDLYILGEYHNTHGMGRYIVIYYGSFERVFGYLSDEAMTKRLRKTLRHEFTHHLEFRAGENALIKEDERQIKSYLGNTMAGDLDDDD